MLQPTNHHRVPYTAGVTATAIARPGTAVGYMTPSGGLMGGVKTSLGCACDQAAANVTSRLRAGPPVASDYQLHEKSRLLGEREAMGALGALGSDAGMSMTGDPYVPLYLAGAVGLALWFFRRK